eukprot:7096935-Pyramimonas_sp.AAC.1
MTRARPGGRSGPSWTLLEALGTGLRRQHRANHERFANAQDGPRGPRGPQYRPKTSQEAPKIDPRRPPSSQERPERLPGESQEGLKRGSPN